MKNTKNQSLKLITGLVFLVLIIIVLVKFVPASKNQSPAASPTVNGAQSTTVSTTIGNSPFLGDKSKAKVAIVEFSDFECPYCQTFFQQSFDKVISEFVNSGQAIFVYRDFMGVGLPAAETDSNAALCVRSLKDDQTYFQMAHLIYQNTGLEGKGIAPDKMIQLASGLGVDSGKFQSCLSSDQFKNDISDDTNAGTAAGVSGTPSFVIGKLDANGNVTGELLVGAQTISVFETTVGKYLK